MSAEPTVVGLASNDPVPGNYIEVNFGVGEPSLGQSEYPVLLMGLGHASGSATVDTVVYGPNTDIPMQSQTDVDSLFGRGSMLARMYKDFTATNKETPVYALLISGSSGAAAATGTITVTNAVTGSTAVEIFVEDEMVSAGLADGLTEAQAATEIASAINSKVDWPVVATTTAGNDVTLTQKTPGSQGNFTRFAVRLQNSAGGFSVSPTASTAMSGGSGTATITSALTTISNTRYYTIVCGLEGQTALAALSTQIDSMAGAVTGKRQRGIGGAVGTLSATTTIANALNAARMELVWLEDSDVPPARLAAKAAGLYTYAETAFPAATSMNFSGRPISVKKPRAGTITTRSEEKSALNAGITPIVVDPRTGNTWISKRVTTKSLSSGQPDYRIRDAHKVYVCDRFADDLLLKFIAMFSSKKVTDDPARGAPIPSADVATPKRVRTCIEALLDQYANILEAIDSLQQTKDNTVVVRSSFNQNRISCQIPLYPMDILDQLVAKIDQVG